MQKEITIQGKKYPVAFNMQAIINFEEIAQKSFFGVAFDRLSDRIALIVSAAFAADKEADLTVEAVMGAQDLDAVNNIIAAYNVVMELMSEFFKKPDVEPADKPADEKPEQESKN